MEVKQIDFSKTLSEDQVYNCILQNYEALGTDWITHQWNWINGIYTSFQDHIKFLIIISLVEKTLNFYHQVNITQNYDQYYAKDNLQIDKFSISELCEKLNLPKETLRRKVLELEKLGVFIGYPNEIATRWLNEMADPNSTFLKNPFKNWKGLRFKILDRFEGVDLKSGNGGMCKGEPTFNIEFSWIRNTKTWSKYKGVQKVDKDLTLEEDKEAFTHFIPTLANSGKDYNCSFENISERFSSEIEAAKGFDDALKNIGLEPVNFGIIAMRAVDEEDDEEEGSFPY